MRQKSGRDQWKLPLALGYVLGKTQVVQTQIVACVDAHAEFVRQFCGFHVVANGCFWIGGILVGERSGVQFDAVYTRFCGVFNVLKIGVHKDGGANASRFEGFYQVGQLIHMLFVSQPAFEVSTPGGSGTKVA